MKAAWMLPIGGKKQLREAWVIFSTIYVTNAKKYERGPWETEGWRSYASLRDRNKSAGGGRIFIYIWKTKCHNQPPNHKKIIKNYLHFRFFFLFPRQPSDFFPKQQHAVWSIWSCKRIKAKTVKSVTIQARPLLLSKFDYMTDLLSDWLNYREIKYSSDPDPLKHSIAFFSNDQCSASSMTKKTSRDNYKFSRG